jgi:hypothetical protein
MYNKHLMPMLNLTDTSNMRETMNKKFFWIITFLLLLVMGIFFNGTRYPNNTSANSRQGSQSNPEITYSKVFFEDHFNSRKFTFTYWGGRQCTNKKHKDLGYVLLTDLITDNSNKLGYCDVNDGEIHFITQAFDIRGDWDLRDYPNNGGSYAKKGGGEIATGFKATNSSNQYHVENEAFNEARKAIIENGQVIKKGWDYTGESYLAENKVVKYHYRFKIDDLSLFGEELSNGAYIFQQHTANNVECRDTTFTYMKNGVEKKHNSMAPTAAMYIVKDSNDIYKLKFTTKNRDHAYYRKKVLTNAGEDPVYEHCTNGENNLPICSLVLYEEVFDPTLKSGGGDLGRWYNVEIEMKVAKQTPEAPGIPGCQNPDDIINPSSSLETYMSCQPSKGYLSLIINGERKTGNGNQLPWIQGKQYFRGVTTQFNDCPSYPKLGNYVLNYDYNEFNQDDHQLTKFDIKFDYFKITNRSKTQIKPHK